MRILLLIIPFLLSGCVVPSLPPTLYIASPVKGQVTISGTPVEEAVVIRKCTSNWFGEFPTEMSTSDKNGLYEFPSIKKFRPIIFLHSPSPAQEFTVQYGGKTYLAHKNFRSDYSKYGELNAQHRFDYVPQVGGNERDGYYVSPVDKRRYQTHIVKDGKYLRLNFELNDLTDSPEPKPIPASSYKEAREIQKNL